MARLGESIVPYTLATRGEDCSTREGVGGYTDCCEGNRVKTWERRSYRSGRRERGEQAVTSAGGKKGYEPAHLLLVGKGVERHLTEGKLLQVPLMVIYQHVLQAARGD